MQGLLADVNVEGHMPRLRRLLESRLLFGIAAEEHYIDQSRIFVPH